jgi:O-antigen ligase
VPGVDPVEGQRQGRQWLGWALLFALIAALFSWWGLDAGAYFGVVFYPGEIGVLALLALLALSVPLRARLGGAPALALACLLALAAWVLLSILWTPTPEVAVADTHRLLLYAALFALGIWVVTLLGERRELALAPVAAAGVLVGVVTLITIGHGTDVTRYLHDDGTLRFPIGYRNANAAFWLICAWPLLALAVRGRLPWLLRAAMVGATTMLLELTVLSQSRGSLPAAALALVILIGLSRRGLKVALFVALAAIPMIPAIPTLLDVFQRGSDNAGAIPLLHDSAGAIAISSLASVGLAALYLGLVEPRVSVGERTVSVLSRVAAVVAVLAVLVGGAAFVSSHGGPTGFVNQRVEELREGTPDLRQQGTRYGVNIGSNRGDIWRVALDEWESNPVRGGGAGSWQVEYLREKDNPTTPHDPHSVEMLMLSEFGLPGILLFAAFVVAAAVAAVRSRRLGPGAVVLVAGGLAGAAQWLIQASYDWLLFYPGVTAPAIFLLGATAAPALAAVPERTRRVSKLAAVALIAVVGLAAGALFLSARYTDRGEGEWQGDLAGAYDDLDRAASLDPFAVDPLLSKGAIAREAGDEGTAVDSFREASHREPENFPAHYLLGLTLLESKPAIAERELRTARRLQPGFPLRAPIEQSRAARARGRAAARAACCTPGK